MNNKNISSLSLQDLFRSLNSSTKGLSSSQVTINLVEKNKKKKTRPILGSSLRLFIKQFESPLVLLLIVAAILSGVMQESADMLIILFILLSSAILGFYQEFSASKAVEELQKMTQLKTRVKREEGELEISTDELFMGDIILLRAGDAVPADSRIIFANELHVDESSLTGESFPVEKAPGVISNSASLSEKTNCLWRGSHVISGNAEALIVNIDSDSLFGQLKNQLSTNIETHFEKDIKDFGLFLLKITLLLSMFILGINLFLHKPIFESVLFSLALAVGMAPELLPAIMTLSMSSGAKRMMEKKVIVKKLSSIINFGEVSILCTDKTGTITEGRASINRIVDFNEEEDQEIIKFAKLNAHFQQGFNNPIDEALDKIEVDIKDFSKLDEIPYDFFRKRLSILVAHKSSQLIVTKGAFTNILDVCSFCRVKDEVIPLNAELIQKIKDQFIKFSEEGFRVLGLATKKITTQTISKHDEVEMIFCGHILIEDHLKPGVKESLKKLTDLNIELKIITGDNRHISNKIAKELGFNNSEILCGNDLNQISSEALNVKVQSCHIFAEIEPHQKERIIKALQSTGKAVAYMGDGVNDVAAIHAADTGISVDSAVDIAKEAADFVLLEKNLNVLADGVYEGRKTFINSIKYILINTGATFGNMFSVAGASLLLPFLPMLPKQILLTNFLTDFPYLAIASDNVADNQLKKPGHWDLKMIRQFMLVFGLCSSVFDFITFYLLYRFLNLNEEQFHTGWFIESVMTELLVLFIVRTPKSFLKSKPGKQLVIISMTAGLITWALPYTSFAMALGFEGLDKKTFVIIILIIAAYTASTELIKMAFFKKFINKQ